MTAITLNLPDALAKKLKTIPTLDTFATNVFTDALEEVEDTGLTDAEIDILKERIAQVDNGEFVTYDEWEKERLARRANKTLTTA
jgi:predicted transcriptional regulator